VIKINETNNKESNRFMLENNRLIRPAGFSESALDEPPSTSRDVLPIWEPSPPERSSLNSSFGLKASVLDIARLDQNVFAKMVSQNGLVEAIRVN